MRVVQFHFIACICPVFPALLVEKIVVSPLYILASVVRVIEVWSILKQTLINPHSKPIKILPYLRKHILLVIEIVIV